MPDKYRIELRDVSNVAASKTAKIILPVGPRYHYVGLVHGYAGGTNTLAGVATNINEIRMKRNTKIQRICSGTQLRDLNVLNGTGFDFGLSTSVPNTAPGVVVPIYLAEPWRQDEVDQDALAWATSNWPDFQIEVDLGAAATPTLTAFAVVDNTPAKAGQGIVKWFRDQIAAQGLKFDSRLDTQDFLQQISLYPDSGGTNAATRVTFRRNTSDILHELSNLENQVLLSQYQMTPNAAGRTANIYDLVLDHDGLLASAINLGAANNASLTIEAAGAMSGTITALIQRFGTPE